MKHKHTKALSVLLTICMIVGLLPWSVLPVLADSETVIDADTKTWSDGNTYKVTSNVTISGARIKVSGTVSLVLGEGTTLTVPLGIYVPEGATLNISGTGALVIEGGSSYDYYKRKAGIGSNDEGEACGTVIINGGTITVTGGEQAAGIGGGSGGAGGTVTINGGTVNATGGKWGAGIGGGDGGAGGTVTINGGMVYATGGEEAAGIGSGLFSEDNGSLTLGGSQAVYGGGDSNPTTILKDSATNRPRYMIVKTFSSEELNNLEYATVNGVKSFYKHTGAAIDVAYTVTAADGTALENGTHYTETITKGGESVQTVQAKGEYTLTITGISPYTGSQTFHFIVSDAIPVTAETTAFEGDTPYCATGTVTVGSRIAVSGTASLILAEGAKLTVSKGINVLEGATLTISGAGELVIDDVDENYAGIGSGDIYTSAGAVNISGGTVYATGGKDGAGIGSGLNGTGGTVTITGGTVYATGGASGAGIGGGLYGTGSTVTITGGTVYATGGANAVGIGGDNGRAGGSLTVSDGMYVMGSADGVSYSLTEKQDGDYARAAYMKVVPLAAQVGDTYYSTFADAVAAWTNGTLTLLCDVTTDSALVVYTTVTLDLAGHTIDRGLAGESAKNSGYVIEVQGDLTLKDTAGGGKITGGNENNFGGGVYVNCGTFTMQGGTITGNQSGAGGGVYIDEGCTFNMTGGTITVNNATGFGGGVCVSEGCTFNVSGSPVISDNWTEGKWDADSACYVRDEDNVRSAADDVQLSATNTIRTYITVTGTLESGASIYVNKNVEAGRAFAQADNYTIRETDAACFHSDAGNSLAGVLEGNEVMFKKSLTEDMIGEIDDQTYSGMAQEPTVTVTDGETTLEENTHYTVSYSNNVNAAASTAASAPTVTVTGTGGYAGTVSKTFTINKKPVTVSGLTALPKTYDGTTAATFDYSTATITGKEVDDDVTVVSATGTFSDKNYGTDIPVAISDITLGGTDVGNYVLAPTGNQENTTGNISKKTLTITGVRVADKEYDGDTDATAITTGATISGVISGEEANVGVSVTGAFDSADKGNDKTVTLSGWTLAGTASSNYEVDEEHSQKTATASITGIQVYISGLTASEKVYDGTDAATVTGTAVLKKVRNNDVVTDLTVSDITAKFADKNVGTGKAVTITGGTLSDSTNYTLVTSATTGLTANIAAKTVTITGLSAANKEYDGNATATVTGTATISGLVSGDAVTITVGSASFADENAGDGKAVTFTGYALTGADAANYTLSAQPGSVTANIAKANATCTAPTAKQDLIYSGGDQALVNAGSATGGEIQYSLDGTDYNTTAPAATGAGDYTVWYRVVGDDNHNNVAPASVTVHIDKAEQAAPDLTSPVIIEPPATTADITGVSTAMEYSTDNKTWTDCTVPFSVGKGVYYIRSKEDANHNAGATATVIVKVEGEHVLTVTGGTGSGSYVKETQVSVSATVPAGEKFVSWTATGVTLTAEQLSSASVTFAMPDSDVTLSATFEDKPLESVSLPATLSLEVGATQTLTPTFAPSDCKYKAVTWESADTSVVTVDENGKLTALAAGGPVNITATSTADRTKTATCAVTVSDPTPPAPTVYSVTVTNDGHGAGSASPASGVSGTEVTLTAVPNAGYHFKEWQVVSGGVAVTNNKFAIGTADVEVKAIFEADEPTPTPTPTPSNPSGHHGGGGGSSSSSTAPTTTNNTDGSKTETKTNSDGSKTETTTKTDGTKTEVTTKTDGSRVETTTAKDGATTKTETAKDGSATTEAKAADGSTGTVKTDTQGNTVSAEAKPSEKAVADAQAKGEPVMLAVEVKATNDSKSAAEVHVSAPASVSAEHPMQVEIPCENLTAGTVAVLVKPDGTEEIIKTSTTDENGVVLTLDGSATIKIVDNTKTFDDVNGSEWYANTVAWAASHEIMNGMGNGNFDADADTTQGMMEQILYNIDGGERAEPAEGESWWTAADNWAANGVTEGLGEAHDPSAPATRETDILMMYNYAKSKGYDVSARADLSRFSDADGVSAEAKDAMAWAVAVGIINGSTDKNGNVILDAQGVATRAQVSAMAERFCEKVAK